MKKIALVTNTLNGGGIERATINIANQLSRSGYKVDLLLAVCKGVLFDEIDQKVNLICLDKKKTRCLYKFKLCPIDVRIMIFFNGLFYNLPKSLRAVHALRDYIISGKPDIVISSPTLINIALIIACFDLPTRPKLLIGEMTVLSKVEKYKSKYILRRLIEELSRYYFYADKIICISSGTGEDLSENYNIPNAKCEVLRNPIDKKLLVEKSYDDNNLRDLDGKLPYILAIGRLESEKDFASLIRAYKLVSDKITTNLIIIGEGSQRRDLQSLIDRLSLSDKVFMPGFVNNPYPYIRNCSLLALTSVREGLPNVILEAIIFNKRIIATNCSQGVHEIISEYNNGKLIPMRDIETLASTLVDFINEPIVENNINIAEEDYLNMVRRYA